MPLANDCAMDNDEDMSNPPDLITTAEVAQRVGKDVATIGRWAKAGILKPAFKLDGLRGAYLFHREDVEALQETASTK